MPRLSGMELLARVKADSAFNGMRFVLASSASDHATMAQASALGAGGYIVKPFEHDMVLAQMAGLAAYTEEAENPRATMQRLGIDGARLLAYLGGFETQLAAAGAEIGPLLATADYGAARASIERLHAGCVTLGLSGAAARLDAVAPGARDGAPLAGALDAALDAVRQQGERARRMQGPA